MSVLKRCLLVLVVAACAHSAPTGDEHRAAAEAELKSSSWVKADNPAAREGMTPKVVVPSAIDSTPLSLGYSPTEDQKAASDRRMAAAFKHLDAARKLEKAADAECVGISEGERKSCPVIAPHVERMEERLLGISIHLKSPQKARSLAAQMRCHLAFAQANSFDRPACPLFVRGVSIELAGDRTINVTSMDPGVARAVKEEARRMFSPPAVVSGRPDAAARLGI